MPSFWEKAKETLKQKASSLGVKVGEYSKYSKYAIQKYNLSKQVEKLASDLGGRTYALFSEKRLHELKDDEEALNYMLKIRGLENEIRDVEEKIRSLKNENKKKKTP